MKLSTSVDVCGTGCMMPRLLTSCLCSTAHAQRPACLCRMAGFLISDFLVIFIFMSLTSGPSRHTAGQHSKWPASHNVRNTH
jgi:hypothetical protein